MLQGALQRLKDILKNQESHKLNTLVEFVDQMGNAISEDAEHDEYLCLKCGDIFKITGYTVTLKEHLARRQIHLSQENKEVVTKAQEPVTIENKEVVETPNSVAEAQEPST